MVSGMRDGAPYQVAVGNVREQNMALVIGDAAGTVTLTSRHSQFNHCGCV